VKYGVLLLVTVAVLAAPAQAAAPTTGFLQRELLLLRGALAKTDRVVNAQAANQTKDFDYTVCFHAQDLDAINQVWHTLNLLAQYNGFTPAPDYPRYDDGGACQRVGMTRIGG
jgi:hypothetical protein